MLEARPTRAIAGTPARQPTPDVRPVHPVTPTRPDRAVGFGPPRGAGSAGAVSPPRPVKPVADVACPFCCLPAARILGANGLAVWLRDAFPVSPGHSLVIPRRHVGSFFEISDDERAAMLALLDQARARADTEFHPDGFNVGINDGRAAGQTVPHLHMHLIPRFAGDVADPRGGVRWVIADKADYWSARGQPEPGPPRPQPMPSGRSPGS